MRSMRVAWRYSDLFVDYATACYARRVGKRRRNRLRHQSIIGNLQAVGQAVSPASEFFCSLGCLEFFRTG